MRLQDIVESASGQERLNVNQLKQELSKVEGKYAEARSSGDKKEMGRLERERSQLERLVDRKERGAKQKVTESNNMNDFTLDQLKQELDEIRTEYKEAKMAGEQHLLRRLEKERDKIEDLIDQKQDEE